MSGIEEVVALVGEAGAEYAAEEAAAAAAAEAVAGYGAAAAGGAVAAGGLTAAELAAMSSVGGGAELGTLAAYGEGSGLLGSAATGAGTYGSAYGAGNTVTDSLLGSEFASTPYGAGETVTDSLVSQPGQGPGMYEELKYKAANALNKAGGMYSKLPGPAQSLLTGQALSGAMPKQNQGAPMMAQRPQQAQGPMPASTPAYNQAPYQAQSFGSHYDAPSQGLLGGGQQLPPEVIEYLKKLKMQQGGGYV